MLEEWLYGLEGLGADLGRLLRAFDAALHDDPSAPIAGSSSALGGESQYLTYTGIVWGAIDRLSAFSSSENEAVIRKWQSQMEVVKDAWTEFKEFLEGQGREPDVENERHSLHEDEDDDDDDDGWGELEAAIGGDKLSPEERDLAEAVSRAPSEFNQLSILVMSSRQGQTPPGITPHSSCYHPSLHSPPCNVSRDKL